MLSGRGLCDELITRPEESYRLWRFVVCDLETSKEEAKSPLKGCEYKPRMGCEAERKKNCFVDQYFCHVFDCIFFVSYYITLLGTYMSIVAT